MSEIIIFFIFHRAKLYSKKTGQNHRSSSAIFDAGAWLVLILLLNVVFSIIVIESIFNFEILNINSSSYSYSYRLIFIVVLICLTILYFIRKINKNRFDELFNQFDKEDDAKIRDRYRINNWIYRITWIGAICSIVCTLINRWNVAGSIF